MTTFNNSSGVTIINDCFSLSLSLSLSHRNMSSHKDFQNHPPFSPFSLVFKI